MRRCAAALFAARGLLGQAAEIGVLRGDFSRHILGKWPGARLHLVDPWETQSEGYIDINNANARLQDAALASTRLNVAEHAARVELVRDFSLPAAKRYADGFFDWVVRIPERASKQARERERAKARARARACALPPAHATLTVVSRTRAFAHAVH